MACIPLDKTCARIWTFLTSSTCAHDFKRINTCFF
jgi:hypothetical protein